MTGPVPVAEADADADARVHAEGWLSLAAAPTFAAMALATAVQDAAAPPCSARPCRTSRRGPAWLRCTRS